jgi:hypothetical protein
MIFPFFQEVDAEFFNLFKRYRIVFYIYIAFVIALAYYNGVDKYGEPIIDGFMFIPFIWFFVTGGYAVGVLLIGVFMRIVGTIMGLGENATRVLAVFFTLLSIVGNTLAFAYGTSFIDVMDGR